MPSPQLRKQLVLLEIHYDEPGPPSTWSWQMLLQHPHPVHLRASGAPVPECMEASIHISSLTSAELKLK